MPTRTIKCIDGRKQHSFAGALTCQLCGAPDESFRSPTRTERARAQGRRDRRNGRSRNAVPYAAADLAIAWEKGWNQEDEHMRGAN